MEYRVSNAQLEELLDYLAMHPALAKGVGHGARTKEKVDREWNKIARKLNALGSGSTKNGQRWRRYWADLKHKAKYRAAAKRQNNTGTGGTPSTRGELTEVEQKILSIIGDAAVCGNNQQFTPVFVSNNFYKIKNYNIYFTEQKSVLSSAGEANSDGEQILASPSKSDQTSQKYTKTSLLSPDDDSNETVQPADQPGDQRNVDPAWLVELEKRRIEAEEKMANAAMIVAEAARINAECARTNTECMKMHCEIMLKLIDTLKK
ncbi:uncharacterized protein ACR2FA_003889 [Aphomia sociella]